jgi:hypothetical protein
MFGRFPFRILVKKENTRTENIHDFSEAQQANAGRVRRLCHGTLLPNHLQVIMYQLHDHRCYIL